MFHKILVALDTSETSQAIFERSIAIAKASDAQVLLLHVLSPFDEDYPNPVYPTVDSMYPGIHTEAFRRYLQLWESYEREGLEMLRSRLAQANAVGVVADFTQQPGNPGRVICHTAETWNADLIVLGRRGRKGLSELLLGSVSNHVVHHAPCSVLTVQGLKQNPAETAPEVQVTTTS